jgi:rhomboid family GlyGly-CTERM serine protease
VITRLPVCTALVIGMSMVIYQSSALSSLLVFDRLAIDQGEFWRLLTGHLVHLSSTHLFANVLALGVVGSVIERLRLPGNAALPVVMALGISIVLYIYEPQLIVYGGLSGIIYGLATYLALFGLGYRRYKAASALLLGTMLWSIARGLLSGEAGTLIPRPEPFQSVPLSHLAGLVAAVALVSLMLARSLMNPHRGGFHTPTHAFRGM